MKVIEKAQILLNKLNAQWEEMKYKQSDLMYKFISY